MSAVTTAWHGSGLETQSLLSAIANNCECEFGMGVRLATCSVHQMLANDQRALNGLLFGRFLAARLIREEFSTEQRTDGNAAARTDR